MTKIININNPSCYGYSGAAGSSKSGSRARHVFLVAGIITAMVVGTTLLISCPDTSNDPVNPLKPGETTKFGPPVEDIVIPKL